MLPYKRQSNTCVWKCQSHLDSFNEFMAKAMGIVELIVDNVIGKGSQFYMLSFSGVFLSKYDISTMRNYKNKLPWLY